MIGCNATHAVEFSQAAGVPLGWCRVFAQYQSWSTSSPWSAALAADARGERVILSFKADIGGVVAGTQDTRIRGIANGLAGVENGILVMYHEPEDNIAAGEFTASQWRQAQERFISLARPILPTWRFAPVLMGWTADPRSGRNPMDYHVPSADLVLWDPYNYAGSNGSAAFPWATTDPSVVDPGVLFGQCVEVSQTYGKPFGIAETGCCRQQSDTQGLRRTAWWERVRDSRVLDPFEMVCHFEMGIADNTGEFAIRNEPASLAAFVAATTAPDETAELKARIAAGLDYLAQAEAALRG